MVHQMDHQKLTKEKVQLSCNSVILTQSIRPVFLHDLQAPYFLL